MRILSQIEILQELARVSGKPCMFVSCRSCHALPREIVKVAPYLVGEDQVLCDGGAILICDNDEELQTHFLLTVGDDGPTRTNTYNGPARVYALTCGADGELQTENT